MSYITKPQIMAIFSTFGGRGENGHNLQVSNWRLILRNRLNLPDLSPEIIARIDEFEQTRLKFLISRRQEKYQRKIRNERFASRNQNKRQDKSGYTGKPKSAY